MSLHTFMRKLTPMREGNEEGKGKEEKKRYVVDLDTLFLSTDRIPCDVIMKTAMISATARQTQRFVIKPPPVTAVSNVSVTSLGTDRLLWHRAPAATRRTPDLYFDPSRAGMNWVSVLETRSTFLHCRQLLLLRRISLADFRVLPSGRL